MHNPVRRWINGYSGRTGQMALKSASYSQKRWLWDLLGSPSWNPCKHFWLYVRVCVCVCVCEEKECMFAWGTLCQLRFCSISYKTYLKKLFVFYTLRVFSVNQFAKSVAKWLWCSDVIHEWIFFLIYIILVNLFVEWSVHKQAISDLWTNRSFELELESVE